MSGRWGPQRVVTAGTEPSRYGVPQARQLFPGVSGG